MLKRIVLALCLLPFLAPVLRAQTVQDLSRALRIAAMVEVMRDEGLVYGAELADELFPGAAGPRWDAEVGRIYDAEVMQERFEQAFAPAIAADPAAVAAGLAFFGSERGQRIVDLEIAARRALMDEEVEAAARARVEDMRKADDPRLALVARYAEANDLIERNVTGALNANLAFYRGMEAGGAFDGGLTEREMLADVWSQEAEIRRETEDWLYPFLVLAYDPLPEEDLRAYLAFSETPAGEALNTALFEGFDALFGTLSVELGRAAAQMLSSEDL